MFLFLCGLSMYQSAISMHQQAQRRFEAMENERQRLANDNRRLRASLINYQPQPVPFIQVRNVTVGYCKSYAKGWDLIDWSISPNTPQ